MAVGRSAWRPHVLYNDLRHSLRIDGERSGMSNSAWRVECVGINLNPQDFAMARGVEHTSSITSIKDWASSLWRPRTVLLPSLLENAASIKGVRSGRAKARLIKRRMAGVLRLRKRFESQNN